MNIAFSRSLCLGPEKNKRIKRGHQMMSSLPAFMWISSCPPRPGLPLSSAVVWTRRNLAASPHLANQMLAQWCRQPRRASLGIVCTYELRKGEKEGAGVFLLDVVRALHSFFFCDTFPFCISVDLLPCYRKRRGLARGRNTCRQSTYCASYR